MQVLLEKKRTGIDETYLESGDTLYVHLCSGDVIEVRPATGVRVTQDAVVVLNGDEVVATFPRRDVYFAADLAMEPPCLK